MLKKRAHLTSLAVILLLCACSLPGVCSMDFSKSFDIVNQYGDTVAIFGSGIYAGDSYIKAPISIGTDFCILFVVVPLFLFAYIKNARENSNSGRLNLMALYAVALYYGASVAFGVKYNRLHLVYVALLGCALFGMLRIFRTLELEGMRVIPTKGMKAFLAVCGVALMVAWLPDIIPTVFSGRPPQWIGVYTTEITYVLDMGIVAPLCLICLRLLGRGDPLGTVLLAAILKLCVIVGIMMIPQTVCQYLSGTELPLPVLLTKTASFVVLGIVAFYLERKLYCRLGERGPCAIREKN